MQDSVFVNRTLNMKKITHIGLDMDHTLIRYDIEAFEGLAHKLILEKLVGMMGYPTSVSKLEFQFDRAIRGLVIDKAKGNLLKLSRHSSIRVSYHGTQKINYTEQKKIYKSTYIDLSDPNYDPIDTSFSIAFASLYAQLVDLKDGALFQELPDYETLAKDIKFALDVAHRDESLKTVIKADLDKYVIKEPELVAGIERFVKHDKKIFIITNSDYSYTRALLDHAINPFLKDHKHWSELFEYIITSAHKPRFFYDNLQFLKVNPEDGSLTNYDDKLVPGIYQGGSAINFSNRMGLDPDEILYVGDHIYGDVIRLKKDCAWRTALVVEELSDEIKIKRETRQDEGQINELMQQKIPLERKIDDLICRRIEEGDQNVDDEIEELMGRITDIDGKIAPLIGKVSKRHNQYWGEVMRVGIEESYFAYQMERFACIYMGKLIDLFTASPRSYFRSFRRDMPHDQ